MTVEGRPYYEWTNGQLEDAAPNAEINREIILRLESRRQELQDYKGTITDAPDMVLEVEKWIAEMDVREAVRKNSQQDLHVGDHVEVIGDRRQELNGGHGIIEDCMDHPDIQDPERAFWVRFDPPIPNCGYGTGAVCFLSNLTKIS